MINGLIDHQDRPPSLAHTHDRPDIDGLRGLAILAVLGYHFFPDQIGGGFVGVDIFFVISGFLISRILFTGLQQNTFDLRDFYSRRVRRIFPALITVVTATYSIGIFILTDDERLELARHILGAATFSTNFILWADSDYFNTDILTKPLMHLWSLGVEEQFYIVWPVAVWVLCKNKINMYGAIGLLLCTSLIWSIYQTSHNGTAAFYSPLTRFWEIMLGSLLAYGTLQKNSILVNGSNRTHQILSFCGFALIFLGLYFIDNDRSWPGYWALLPTLGTALIIAARPVCWINRQLLAHPVLRNLGLISYPLYLWHWPLVVYTRMFKGSALTPLDIFHVAIISLTLSMLTYRFCEAPVRRGSYGKEKVVALGIAMFLLGWFGMFREVCAGDLFKPPSKIAYRLESWPYWATPACTKQYNAVPCQTNSPAPKFMLLGDSHANHLFPGLAFGMPKLKVVSVGTCPPLDQVFLKNEKSHGECDGTNSLGINKDILGTTPSITTVILSANWDYVFMQESEDRAKHGQVKLVSQIQAEQSMDNMQLLNHGLARTIDYLQVRNLNIVFVRKTPQSPLFDLRTYCSLRKHMHTTRQNCTVSRSAYEQSRQFEDTIVANLKEQFPRVIIYDPADAMCDADNCYLMRNGTLYFRDGHHLNLAGSLMIAEDFKKFMIKNYPNIL
jgi:peptidoglycan/LPS O-acetylase OafA/YrhL